MDSYSLNHCISQGKRVLVALNDSLFMVMMELLMSSVVGVRNQKLNTFDLEESMLLLSCEAAS